jgi:hypothetical protein
MQEHWTTRVPCAVVVTVCVACEAGLLLRSSHSLQFVLCPYIVLSCHAPPSAVAVRGRRGRGCCLLWLWEWGRLCVAGRLLAAIVYSIAAASYFYFF